LENLEAAIGYSFTNFTQIGCESDRRWEFDVYLVLFGINQNYVCHNKFVFVIKDGQAIDSFQEAIAFAINKY